MSDKFTCAECGGEFEKLRSDCEAMGESRELWGDVPQDELAVVCDDCFKEITAEVKSVSGLYERHTVKSEGERILPSAANSEAFNKFIAKLFEVDLGKILTDASTAMRQFNSAFVKLTSDAIIAKRLEGDRRYRRRYERIGRKRSR